MTKAEVFLFMVAAALFVLGAVYYPQVSPLVASHWDAAGNANGYAPKAWGMFALPIAFFIVALVLFFIPRMDPKHENIEKFRRYFDRFLVGIALFFYYIYSLFLSWNLGHRFNFMLWITPGFAALFYLIGSILPHTELNWTIGIRTPWTISSESVWRKTHRVGGIVFKISAVIALLGISFPAFTIWFVVLPPVIGAFALFIYSYVLYAKER